MTNYRSDRQTKLDINLDRICVASRYYRATQLPGQLGESDPLGSEAHLQELNGGPTSVLRIGWQERVTMHYLIVPMGADDSKNGARYTLSQCHLIDGKSDIAKDDSQFLEGSDAGGLAVTDFICLEHAHEKFKVRDFFVASIKSLFSHSLVHSYLTNIISSAWGM